MLTTITLEVARSKNVLVHLWPSSKLWARILQHFQMYTCTFFVAMPSQSPLLPFDSVQACLLGWECVHFGQQANMWFTHIQVCCVRKGLRKVSDINTQRLSIKGYLSFLAPEKHLSSHPGRWLPQDRSFVYLRQQRCATGQRRRLSKWPPSSHWLSRSW